MAIDPGTATIAAAGLSALSGKKGEDKKRGLDERSIALQEEQLKMTKEDRQRAIQWEDMLNAVIDDAVSKGAFDSEAVIAAAQRDIQRSRELATTGTAARARLSGMPGDATSTQNQFAAVDLASERDLRRVRTELPLQRLGTLIDFRNATKRGMFPAASAAHAASLSQMAGTLRGMSQEVPRSNPGGVLAAWMPFLAGQGGAAPAAAPAPSGGGYGLLGGMSADQFYRQGGFGDTVGGRLTDITYRRRPGKK